MNNLSLREQPRRNRAELIPLQENASILKWLESTGRLRDRDDQEEFEERDEEIERTEQSTFDRLFVPGTEVPAHARPKQDQNWSNLGILATLMANERKKGSITGELNNLATFSIFQLFSAKFGARSSHSHRNFPVDI